MMNVSQARCYSDIADKCLSRGYSIKSFFASLLRMKPLLIERVLFHESGLYYCVDEYEGGIFITGAGVTDIEAEQDANERYRNRFGNE